MSGHDARLRTPYAIRCDACHDSEDEAARRNGTSSTDGSDANGSNDPNRRAMRSNASYATSAGNNPSTKVMSNIPRTDPRTNRRCTDGRYIRVR